MMKWLRCNKQIQIGNNLDIFFIKYDLWYILIKDNVQEIHILWPPAPQRPRTLSVPTFLLWLAPNSLIMKKIKNLVINTL